MDATSTSKKPKLVIVEDDHTDTNAVINQVTGNGKAGGAQTNKNGLSYEDLTDLKPFYEECIPDKKDKFKTVKFVGYDRHFINANKSALHKWMEKYGEKNQDLQPAAGCKEPDEAYIDTEREIAFIIEKKFQQTGGSVDEKIQTGPFKKEHYQELFPNYKIHYMYCLSDWFRRDEYKSVLNYLKKNLIPVFWGSSETYKQEMIAFMNSSL
jgi:hypothetical protein